MRVEGCILDTFRMKCFISVAKHKNMSEAAREMFITRPAMTAQMNGLESEIGAVLLLRDKKKIQLTPAGQQVLETLVKITADLDQMGLDARAIDANTHERIHIGYHGPAEWKHFFNLIASYKHLSPEVMIEVVQNPWNLLVASVLDGSLDTAIVELSDIEGLSNLQFYPLFSEGLCAVMRADNPLATQKSLLINQFKGEKILFPSTRLAPRFFQGLQNLFNGKGITVRDMGLGDISEATIVLAGAGEGIAIMPRSFRQFSDDIAYVDIDEPECIARMGIVWRANSNNPALTPFLKTCKTWNWH